MQIPPIATVCCAICHYLLITPCHTYCNKWCVRLEGAIDFAKDKGCKACKRAPLTKIYSVQEQVQK